MAVRKPVLTLMRVDCGGSASGDRGGSASVSRTQPRVAKRDWLEPDAESATAWRLRSQPDLRGNVQEAASKAGPKWSIRISISCSV